MCRRNGVVNSDRVGPVFQRRGCLVWKKCERMVRTAEKQKDYYGFLMETCSATAASLWSCELFGLRANPRTRCKSYRNLQNLFTKHATTIIHGYPQARRSGPHRRWPSVDLSQLNTPVDAPGCGRRPRASQRSSTAISRNRILQFQIQDQRANAFARAGGG